MSTALYTGSFDPITKGHLDIIRRASKMFEKVIVGVGDNPLKKYTFSKRERVEMIARNITDLFNVVVNEIPHGKLTADIAYEAGAVILKGVRMGSADFDYEWLMADINRAHQHGLQTVVLPASPQFNSVSSSAAKEICKLHGNTQDFVPLNVKAELEKKIAFQVRVNVTGTIGAGKSTLCHGLVKEDSIGLTHNIDMDVIAKDILFERQEPVYKELQNTLQRELSVLPWNPKTLGAIVFKDEGARKLLNELIRQPLLTRIRAELVGKTGTILFNGALIIEAGWSHLANHDTIILDVDPELQLQRLRTRNYTPQQTKRRIKAQLTAEQKRDKLMEKIHEDRYGVYELIDTTGVEEFHIREHAYAFIQRLKR